MNESRVARRVFVLGATGTIGQATVHALVRRGHDVVCLVRPRAGIAGSLEPHDSVRLLEGAQVRFGDVSDPESLARDGFRGERVDALVSCLASRSGAPKDAWAIDHLAKCQALAAAQNSAVSHVVLLSAICVQKPMLAQKAELARIGRYYATESMLVLNGETGCYDAAATPSTGTQTLYDYYAALIDGAAAPDRGDHAVF